MILSKLTANIILELANKPLYYNSSSITRAVGATYSHITKLLKSFEDDKIIYRVQKDKRQKIISLTKKGYKINDYTRELIAIGVGFR